MISVLSADLKNCLLSWEWKRGHSWAKPYGGAQLLSQLAPLPPLGFLTSSTLLGICGSPDLVRDKKDDGNKLDLAIELALGLVLILAPSLLCSFWK